jgi:hypothetical protein
MCIRDRGVEVGMGTFPGTRHTHPS